MEYAHPEVLVGTEWVASHLTDRNICIAEVDYDAATNYKQGHVPGAVLFDWRADFSDWTIRDIAGREAIERVLSRNGISNDTTLILYGDLHNWFAAFAFWVLKYYGMRDVRIMDGGRRKWIAERRELSTAPVDPPRARFVAAEPDEAIRTYREEVARTLDNGGGTALVDVRTAEEFHGTVRAPMEYVMEQAQRGGHIPGAVNIPWALSVNDDGTFKGPEALRDLFHAHGVTPDKEVVTYCRVGERSAHTWFVLCYLLGYSRVRNYDGSWSEWGNSIRMPIER